MAPTQQIMSAEPLVAGRIGITPLVSMAQTLEQRGAAVRLRYAMRTPAELAFLPLPQGAPMYICGPVFLLDAARCARADAGRPLADLRFEAFEGFGSSGRCADSAPPNGNRGARRLQLARRT